MRTLVVLSSKGGVGKTTASVLIAHVLGRAGERVLLVDADAPQHSAQRWVTRGAVTYPEQWDRVTCVATASDGDIARLGQLHSNYDWAVVDTAPGLDNQLLASTVDQADYVVIPAAPAPLEIEALGQTLRDVVLPSRKPYGVVLWRLDGRRVEASAAARQQLRDLGAEVLDAGVRRLLAIEDAPVLGAPMREWGRRGGADAAQDVEAVVREILLRLLNPRTAGPALPIAAG